MARLAARDLSIGTIIDIGASNGAWSRLAMEHFPHARVLAIEPLEERRAELETLRQDRPTVDFVIAAAGADSEGRVELSVTADLDGSTIGGKTGEPRHVPSCTVDALVAEKQLPGPYLLKFDTHGYEAPIIEGASRTLGETQAIIMELYNFDITGSAVTFDAMCGLLRGRGFRCVDLVDPLLRPGDTALWQLDGVFMRADHDLFKQDTFDDGKP